MTGVLLLYLCVGAYLVWWLPPNEPEQHHFGINREQMQIDHFLNFGMPMPARLPWRLPAEYWLTAWTQDLYVARFAALGVSGLGLGLTMAYAAQLAGPLAGVLAGLIICSSPTVVSALVTASYVAPVATLWVGGLYALHLGHPLLAAGCGVALACLRPTSWGQALWLLWASGGIVMAAALAAYFWLEHRQVIESQGWALRLRGIACNVARYPRDGWHKGARELVKRYEAWGAWSLLAGVTGHWHPEARWLLGLTLAVLLATHLPRILYRPKWVLGYLPDFAFPVATGLAVVIA